MSNKLVFPEHPTYNNESVVSDHGISYVAMIATQLHTDREINKRLAHDFNFLEQKYTKALAEVADLTLDGKRVAEGWVESQKEIARLDAENRKLQDSLKFSRSVNTSLTTQLVKAEAQRDILIRAIDKVK